jgi:hypothetical protein
VSNYNEERGERKKRKKERKRLRKHIKVSIITPPVSSKRSQQNKFNNTKKSH